MQIVPQNLHVSAICHALAEFTWPPSGILRHPAPIVSPLPDLAFAPEPVSTQRRSRGPPIP